MASAYPEQQGGQSLGRQEYRYALAWHAGDWQSGAVCHVAQRFTTPPLVVQTGGHPGALPPEASLFALEPASLVLSAFKRAEDRNTLVIRLFNPTGAVVAGRLNLAATITRAWLTNLNEDRQQETPGANPHRVAFDVAPSGSSPWSWS